MIAGRLSDRKMAVLQAAAMGTIDLWSISFKLEWLPQSVATTAAALVRDGYLYKPGVRAYTLTLKGRAVLLADGVELFG